MFIYNPKTFRLFIEISRKYSLNFEVLDKVNELLRTNQTDYIVVDDEGLNIIKSSLDISNIMNKLIVVNPLNMEERILRLLGLEGDSILIIGIDIGRKHAFAIICNKLVIEVGYAENPDDLIDKIENVRLKLKARKVIVRIGIPPNKELMQKSTEFVEKFMKLGYEVYLVSEKGSSKEYEVPVKLLSESMGDLPRDLIKSNDIKAAITLALRSGIRLK